MFVALVGTGLAHLRSALADGSCTQEHSSETQVSISKADDQLPASDLMYQGRMLSPEEAWQKKQSGELPDLSLLDPDSTTDEWKGIATSGDEQLDHALPIQNGDSVSYLSQVCGSTDRSRFNVRTSSVPAQTLNLMLSPNMHSFLLRKELLRKLGYTIPPLKFLSSVKVRFPDAKTRDDYLLNGLQLVAVQPASYWCGMASSVIKQLQAAKQKVYCSEIPDQEVGGDPLLVKFQDLVAMQATPVIYNLTLGPPIQRIPGTTQLRPAGLRIIRALALVYGLLDLPESVNLYDWYAAHEENGGITLHVPDQANFGTTLDDALWILRRMARLSRQDFTDVVANSYFPEPVARLLVEKIISRRNSLMSVFGLKTPDLPFDAKVTDLPTVQDGKLLRSAWPGYATRFAGTDAQSPLSQLKWYLVSELEANAMSALMTKANAEIPSLSVNGAYKKHSDDLFQKALQQFVDTGQVQTVPFGAWVAPIANGSVQISRDVVFGQYLGTNNLVSLADTFGFSVNAGLLIGFDGVTPGVSLQGMIQGSLNLSLTRLKRLNSLKDGVTEPINKELVAWVFKDVSEVFQKMADAKSNQPSPTDSSAVDKANTALQDDLKALDDFIGTSDSLILTESISGDGQLSAGVTSKSQSHPNSTPVFGAKLDLNEIVLSRLHFYRKDSKTILVFKDFGELIGPTLSLGISLGQQISFPILSITAKKVGGTAQSKIYTVDVTPDVKNSNLYTNAQALASALRTGSTAVLDAQPQKPMQVSVAYSDGSSSIQFFQWMRRTLKTNGTIQVQLPDGTAGRFLTLSNGRQTGMHYQTLATQAATYLLQRLTKSTTFSIDTAANPNPGQSFLGHSQTRSTSFQSRFDHGVADPYVRVQYRWEGWNLSIGDALNLVNSLSKKYGFKLYQDGFLGQARDVKMYELTLMLNFYDTALDHLLTMTPAAQAAFVRKYYAKNFCEKWYMNDLADMTSAQISGCGSLERFNSAFNRYRRGERDPKDLAQDIVDTVDNLEQFADFGDMVQVVGGADNMYLRSQITGFREGNEATNPLGQSDPTDPIVSNTFGKVDPYNPTGVVDTVENLLGIDNGEFNMNWLRDVL